MEGDIRLRAACSGSPQEDDSAALNSSAVVSNDSFLKEIVITHFTSKFQILSEVLIQFKMTTWCVLHSW